MSGLTTIVAAAHAIRRKDLTPQGLVADCLQKISSYDPQVRAWVVVDADDAQRDAQRAARELAAGDDRGPLHGIPLGIKDIIDVAGLPTRAGSSLTEPGPSACDAAVVRRLRAAGAIILGKTVTTEFAWLDPPPTANPWQLDRTPGGSSSGSAAAVALGMCTAAIGSQTGGSITRPASFCGVSGCKPTFGRVSRWGVVPVSFHLDHVGPIARTAADCAILLRAIAGDDPQDPACSPRANFELVDPQTIAAPRLGVIRPFFFESADPEVAELTLAAIDKLVAAGAAQVELPLPEGFDQVHALHRRVMAAEAADYHHARYGAPRPGYSQHMAALLEEGYAIRPSEYRAARQHQVAFGHASNRLLADVDAALTPATVTAAPDRTTTGDPRFNSPWSYAGVPTVSIPIALTKAGLPVALQLIGKSWSEGPLLAVAQWCEARLGFEAEPAMLG